MKNVIYFSIWGEGKYKEVAKNILKFEAVRLRRLAQLNREDSAEVPIYGLPMTYTHNVKDGSTILERVKVKDVLAFILVVGLIIISGWGVIPF